MLFFTTLRLPLFLLSFFCFTNVTFAQDSNAFDNATWKITKLLDQEFDNGSIRLTESRLSVSMECNYIGGYTFVTDEESNAFSLGGAGRITGKGCFGEDTSLEEKFAETLPAVTHYKLNEDDLSLLDKDGTILIELHR